MAITGQRNARSTRKPHNRMEQKTAEIQRSLVHRARLRKAYFKMLEKDGQKVPDKTDARNSHNDDDKNGESQSDDEGNFFEGEVDGDDKHAKHSKQQDRQKKHAPSATTYEDRKRMIKERKRQRKIEAEERERQRAAEKEQKLIVREKHKKQMKKFTKKGQPVMRARIDRLLDKIKSNEQ